MRIMRFPIIAGLILVSLVSVLARGNAQSAPPPQVRLQRGTFDLHTAARPALSSELAAVAPGPYAIVQFRSPITPQNRRELENTGVQIMEYLPDYAYLVRGTANQLDAASSVSSIYGRTELTIAETNTTPTATGATPTTQTITFTHKVLLPLIIR